MKLLIQIPCFDERDQLPATFADLPRRIEGIDTIEVLLVDDGSRDDTAGCARALGVHHVLRLPAHQGLAAAYCAGIEACLGLGADVIVNTDADGQYPGRDIAALVRPILEGRADLVVGDRRPGAVAHFSLAKRLLQRLGSHVLRQLSGTRVRDATSGFRALNRRAALGLFVHNRFTYTLETLLQAGQRGLLVENVLVGSNPATRPSRLFSSTSGYVRRSALVILRSYLMYQPVRTFGCLAAVLLAVGLLLGGRFLYYYLLDPSHSGHVQSLLVGVGAVVLAFLVALLALLGDLLAANRRLLEQTLERLRRIDLGAGGVPPGVESTGAAPWRNQDEG